MTTVIGAGRVLDKYATQLEQEVHTLKECLQDIADTLTEGTDVARREAMETGLRHAQRDPTRQYKGEP